MKSLDESRISCATEIQAVLDKYGFELYADKYAGAGCIMLDGVDLLDMMEPKEIELTTT